MLSKKQEYLLLYDMIKEGFDIMYKDIMISHNDYVVGKPYQVYFEGKNFNEFYSDIKPAVETFMRLKFNTYFRSKK